jgi:hypothetical protein
LQVIVEPVTAGRAPPQAAGVAAAPLSVKDSQ